MTDNIGPKPATEYTKAVLDRAGALVSFDDPADFGRARRGLLATIEDPITDPGGRAVWTVSDRDFIRNSEQAPGTVHPGLWRQARLNTIHGLFEVVPGVYQARGYDISNITFLQGDEGWLIIDPLTSADTARACLALANQTLGERPVKAVIYTHSHTDHYGGIRGVVDEADVKAGNVRIVAPEGFLEEVVNENVIAGPAMLRRAVYQFGPLLPIGPRTQVDAGLGCGIPFGSTDLIAPTEEISATGQELVLDGIRVVFQSTPDTEAKAEMNFFFPDHSLLCMAENCTHTMHNLYPIRGAQMRNSLAWSKYIGEAIELFADQAETMFSTHHWPRFGADDVRSFLALQRDLYRFMHDQAMRLANLGRRPDEIAAELELPRCFAGDSHVQGYYGTLSHNVRSVYNRYLGWYDGNPANLEPHPPVEAASRYLDYMGGAAQVIARAKTSFEAGDYRWVAEVLTHVVYDDPKNQEARTLQADAMEQLGYQTESGTWRNAYLMGAHELRHGTPEIATGRGRQFAQAMTVEQIIDMMGASFDPAAFDVTATFNLALTDLDEHHVLGVSNCAFHHLADRQDPSATASIRTDRVTLSKVLAGTTPLDQAVQDGTLQVEGDAEAWRRLLDSLASFGFFGLIEP